MIDKDNLFWGKPCRRERHQKADGTNLRRTVSNRCVECDKGSTLTYKDQDELYLIVTSPKVPKRSEEEIKKLKTAASMRWNARNKDKTNEYRRTYEAKEERKQLRKEQYAAKTAEAKAAQIERQRLHREAKRLLNPPKEKLSHEEQRLRTNQRAREKYASLSMEERRALWTSKKERAERNKDQDNADNT